MSEPRQDELAALQRELEELREERNWLRATLDAMAEGVLVTDDEGVIVLANTAVRALFKLKPEVVGRSPSGILEDNELDDTIAQAAREHTRVSRELTLPPPRPKKISVSVAPVARGSATVAVFSDVTELRRLETMRRDFVANVSHELRTPIAAVRAAVETLECGAAEDPVAQKEFLAIIARHAERLHRIVEDLLELSRLEAGEVRLEPGALDLQSTLQHAIESFALAAQKKSSTLHVELEEGLPRVHVDRRSFEHVIFNLVDNALKYTPEHSRITLHANHHEDCVRVTVEDNGPGIAPHHLPRLFERFYRVDTGRSRNLGGTGLGLAIVKHHAEAMGGTVSVESTLGVGTMFHLDLPIAGKSIPPGERVSRI